MEKQALIDKRTRTPRASGRNGLIRIGFYRPKSQIKRFTSYNDVLKKT